ncbi:Ca2+-transporting ATPase [Panacagrimonas perspica]|uniref:Ca2+-transporting ATPase n=1 Tax=Panacagrimonas perspica TaxID=381431 RepID=A0A4S3KB04_9GAMM|nr:cation-transporting P-type ATPase [Panacagrimonas perspica]TDU32638.1 Ca2+-transporting ATPase [Panacagrimonas perspica]THD05526.1 haloacid dehalogenase [Panacagrimonas perspica]
MRHQMPADRVAHLDDPSRGLSTAEATARREAFGANDIVDPTTNGWREVLRDTVRDPMIWFLVGTAVLFAALGDYPESAVLSFALLPILGMDAWLHRRTRASTEGLTSRLAVQSRVIRDGAPTEPSTTELVPGDLVLVSASEYLPADGVIVAGEALQIDESALTGESLPQRKRPLVTGDGSATSGVDDACWGAAGTRLLTGELRLRIVNTGANTLYGEIVRLAQAGPLGRTPLQQALGSMVTALLFAAGVLCLGLALTRYFQGHGIVDALLSAVTLAVAALPEEFPVVFTVFLGVGVFRLARRKALVRRAVVVENIGRVTAICSDKTGTLTEGRLRLEHVLPAPPGTEPSLLLVAARASRRESNDPMDLAILECAGTVEGARLATFPFNEQSRREVAVFDAGDGRAIAVAKGAPETILAMSHDRDSRRDEWLRQAGELAASGHKVIACAHRVLSEWPGGEPDRDFEFAGLLAFEDPLRPGVADAVGEAQNAGIRILMITGDHPLTAGAIAREAGIGASTPRLIDGAELSARLARGGADALRDIDVVARCLPAQKLGIVRSLQSSGEIVAVTGDGVNDVPALQGADIGIAMGERGTRSAREIAAIVLLDDNFRTIVGAIAEGRQLFANLQLSFAYLLIIHLPLVLTAAFVPLAGFPLLYLPIHIVWLELIIHPTAILVFQQLPAGARLQRLRRDSRHRFFGTREWTVIGLCGALLTVLVGSGYAYSLGSDGNVGHARSMAMLTLIVASAATTAGLCRFRTRAAWIAVAATLASAALLIPVKPIAALLKLEPLHGDEWLIAIGAGLLVGGATALFHRPRAAERPAA